MLAARRFRIPRWLAPLFAFAPALFWSQPLLAQFQGVPATELHGVPPSGLGGTSAGFSAVRPYAGTPAYGASAFGCCGNFFFPSSFTPLVPYSPIADGRREHRRRHREGEVAVVAEPVYIPYAVAADDDGGDQDAADAVAPPRDGEPATHSVPPSGKAGVRQFRAQGVPDEQESGGSSGDDASPRSPAEPADYSAPDPPAPVLAQPTTVLVFKDGHRSNVSNYAIVSDTLFDFSGDRTHKIRIADLDLPATQSVNDASGVEFKLPPQGDGEVKSGTN